MEEIFSQFKHTTFSRPDLSQCLTHTGIVYLTSCYFVPSDVHIILVLVYISISTVSSKK